MKEFDFTCDVIRVELALPSEQQQSVRMGLEAL
jgi:hypothetical protein